MTYSSFHSTDAQFYLHSQPCYCFVIGVWKEGVKAEMTDLKIKRNTFWFSVHGEDWSVVLGGQWWWRGFILHVWGAALLHGSETGPVKRENETAFQW